MTRLDYARQLFDYDAAITPQRELEHAKRWLREAEIRHRLDQQALDDLDDNTVYEWSYDSSSQCHFAIKREIAKRTPKQIRLAPKHTGDKQTYLPRQPLEAGELVVHGNGWWLPDFVFGWVIRPALIEQYGASSAKVEEFRVDVRRIENAIASHELVLNQHQSGLVDLFMQIGEAETVRKPVDWKMEGF
ncbi:hypothetical protein Pan258_29470 [Symmachiella dynata]|uniref:hypothetical protein n=1 Tax=Symmachiella dynata TaxID=2527995 RepID=UPI001189C469|nr:hypothetical protein [Symmachiella dynata]QDT48900.1 hypothetical protein Pan258_29470 [Symmachiella dynata]